MTAFPPRQRIGGRPKNTTCIAYNARHTPLRQTRDMAEGVKIPEKNACFWRFGPPIGGGGEDNPGQGGTCQSLVRWPVGQVLGQRMVVHNSFENKHLQ